MPPVIATCRKIPYDGLGAQSGRSVAFLGNATSLEVIILDLLSRVDDSEPEATGCLGQSGLTFSMLAPRDQCRLC